MTLEELKLHCGELEDLAYRDAELPAGLSTPGQLLFLKFRCLYQYAKLSGMSQQQGKQEKQEILMSYITDCLNAEIYAQMGELLNHIRQLLDEASGDPALMANELIRQLDAAVNPNCAGAFAG